MNSRTIRTDVLTFSAYDEGEGPLVILLHGFPDLAIGWRHQIKALSSAGYRVVAPDLRGYGGTGGTNNASEYSIFELIGDVVALVEALGEKQAVLVGHDWGAGLAWQCALARPDMFRAVMGISVPFTPRRSEISPIEGVRRRAEKDPRGALYFHAFQDPEAYRELDADPARALLKMFWAFDGNTPPEHRSNGMVAHGSTMLQMISDEAVRPPWMDQALFDHYVETFSRNGFTRPLNWYRKMDANWHRSRWQQGLKITVPTAFLVGDADPVRKYAGHFETEQAEWMADLRMCRVIEGAGHWVTQERPDEVNDAILTFLWELSLD